MESYRAAMKSKLIQFPPEFLWGTATSAYQIEGSHDVDGRKPSIWDTFSKTPGRVANGDTGDVATDSYRRLEEDVALLKQMGARAYRFSIAWPRVMPHGRGEVNPLGIAYYKRLVGLLRDAGIAPMATLYHWDLPQALHNEGGWMLRRTAEDFARFAGVMFDALGESVPYWFTVNEPWCASFLSHAMGEHAPGERDLGRGLTVAHHLLLGHGLAMTEFRKRKLGGQIGMAPNVDWREPYAKGDAILMSQGKIVSIGTAPTDLKEYDVVIDAGGATAIPGFIDSQVHNTFGDWTPRQKTVGFLESYTHGGTTTAIGASEVHVPGRPKDPAGVKALAVAAKKCFEHLRPGGMRVHAGSIILEPGLVEADFKEVAAQLCQV